jgi:hypothetical protein
VTALSTPRIFRGLSSRLQYIKTDYADTVDFTITADVTGERRLDRVQPHRVNDQASARGDLFDRWRCFGLCGGWFCCSRPICFGRDRVKIVINTAACPRRARSSSRSRLNYKGRLNGRPFAFLGKATCARLGICLRTARCTSGGCCSDGRVIFTSDGVAVANEGRCSPHDRR